jgi:hypothetical protein
MRLPAEVRLLADVRLSADARSGRRALPGLTPALRVADLIIAMAGSGCIP